MPLTWHIKCKNICVTTNWTVYLHTISTAMLAARKRTVVCLRWCTIKAQKCWRGKKNEHENTHVCECCAWWCNTHRIHTLQISNELYSDLRFYSIFFSSRVCAMCYVPTTYLYILCLLCRWYPTSIPFSLSYRPVFATSLLSLALSCNR